MSRLFAALAPLFVVVLLGCGADGDPTSAPVPSGPAAEGRQVYQTSGCAACHGSNGEGLVGPPLVGLFGSEVELQGGSTETADADYLAESIKEPGAKRVDGYRLPMPTNGLNDEEVDAIVAYIEALAATEEAAP